MKKRENLILSVWAEPEGPTLTALARREPTKAHLGTVAASSLALRAWAPPPPNLGVHAKTGAGSCAYKSRAPSHVCAPVVLPRAALRSRNAAASAYRR